MPLYTQSIKNLKGGISQQPDILRFADQGEEQVNAWSSESDGLQKRPPVVFIGKLPDLPDNAKLHLINRDETEQYYVAFTGTGIKVFDLSGREYIVKGDMKYVTTNSPIDLIRVVTVADYTFIVNKSMVVKGGTELSHPGYDFKHRALINLRGGQYGRKLTVSINGGPTIEHQLPAGNDAVNDPPKVDAQNIGAALRNLLAAAYPSYTFNLGSGYIEIIAPTGTDITRVDTADGYANQLINAVLDTVQTIGKLPLAAPDGYIIRIQGETNSSADEYYVRYDSQRKTWRETAEPGIVLGMDPETMPHALIRQADGNFELTTLEWSERGAGNDDTNPMPSFVGGKINDVFFYRNRLGFLSGENIIMSRSAGYFSFFPKSVATLSDDDPIDVSVSSPRISLLKYAIPFAEQLLVWSDEVQFVITSSGVLTSKTIQPDVGSEFAVSDAARPFSVGRSVFFSSPRGTFTSINRYFAVADVTDVKDADDTTGHVLSYIPNGVFDIQGSSTENFISVATTGAPSKLFIYKFLFKDGVQLQASWSHWELGVDRVLAHASIGSTMYVVAKINGDTQLGYIEHLKESTDFEAEPYRIHADWKSVTETEDSAYDQTSNSTQLVVPTHLAELPEVLHVSTEGSVRIVSTIGAEEVKLGNVAVFGDSTVDGYGTSLFTPNPVDGSGVPVALTDHRAEAPFSWSSLLSKAIGTGGADIYNVGYQGRSIVDGWAIDNFKKAVLDNPSYVNVKAVVICFGLNDFINAGWSIVNFKRRYAELIKLVRDSGLEPIVMTSQPVTNRSERPYDRIQGELVATQVEIAEENACRLIDLNGLLLSSGADLKTLQFDGMHFSDAGHSLVSTVLRSSFESLLSTGFSVVKVEGDLTGQAIVGVPFKMRYSFSRFLIKHEDQNGTQTEDSGRLQLRRAWVNYQNTGALDALVTNEFRTFRNTLNGYTLGNQSIGTPNIGDGQFRFPMNGNALTTRLVLESDYPTPVSIVGCGWEASYARKAQSI